MSFFQACVTGQPQKILYKNPSPNSASSCRPLRIAFEKETRETIKVEGLRLRTELLNLQPLQLTPNITIKYEGLLTLVDGKVIQQLMECPSSSSCPICMGTYRQIASQQGDFSPKEGALQFGLSLLHFIIRAFEALLHIGYRQDIKKNWATLAPSEKEIVKQRTLQVKEEFRTKLGLIVDQPCPGWAGNSNSGNVARKAFSHAGMQ